MVSMHEFVAVLNAIPTMTTHRKPRGIFGCHTAEPARRRTGTRARNPCFSVLAFDIFLVYFLFLFCSCGDDVGSSGIWILSIDFIQLQLTHRGPTSNVFLNALRHITLGI